MAAQPEARLVATNLDERSGVARFTPILGGGLTDGLIGLAENLRGDAAFYFLELL